MRKLFYQEYEDELNEIRNVLLKYYLEFNRKIGSAYGDFMNGLITEAEYEEIKGYHITDIHTDLRDSSKKSPYSLSKEQIDYIRKYAVLDDNGDLLLDSLNPVYDENLKRRINVFESIRVYYFYSSLDLDGLRSAFSTVMGEYFDDLIDSLQDGINRGDKEIIVNGKTFDEISALKVIEKLRLQKQVSIDKINVSSREDIYAYIRNFYNVDYSYYDWYATRKMQHDAKDGSLYAEHENSLAVVSNLRESLKDKEKEYREAAQEMNSISSQYTDLIIISQVELDKPIETKFTFKSLFGMKNNLDDLKSLFGELVKVPGAIEYINSLDSYNLTDSFDIYMANKYPLISFVDVNEFKKNFLDHVSTFLYKKLFNKRMSLGDIEKDITEQSEMLDSAIQKATNEASYLTSISNSLSVKANLDGFTEEEQTKIVEDMIEYLGTSYVQEMGVAAEMRNSDELQKSKGSSKQGSSNN